jgi:hypothetical protein
MAKYKVTFDDSQTSVLRDVARALEGYDDQLLSAANAIDARDVSMAALRQKMRDAAAGLPPLARRILAEGNVWARAVGVYRDRERGLSLQSLSTDVSKIVSAAASTVEAEKSDNWIYELFKDMFEDVGYLGSVALMPMILQAISNGDYGIAAAWGIKAGADGVASLIDIIGTVTHLGKVKSFMEPGAYKEVASAAWAEKIFGIAPGFSSGTASWTAKFGEQWAKQLDKFNFAKSGAKAVVPWIGVAISGFVNGFENYEEHGGSSVRMVGETVIETAVDVGLAVAAVAAVAATLPASAPVLAAAILGGGAVFLGNKVVELITGGRDIGEVVSDFIMDTGGAVGNFIGDGINMFGDAVSGGVNAVASWFGSINPFKA